MPPGEVQFTQADSGVPPAVELIEAMVAEMLDWYGRIDAPGTPSATPADFTPPSGTFLVGRVDGEPVACGGVKRLDATTAEIKRMYVRPSHRGRGVSRALLGALEDEARRLGYAVVRLDTGRYQDVAKGLYDRSGYVQIPDYNANPNASYWAEKSL